MLKRIVVEDNKVFVVETITGTRVEVPYRLKNHVNPEYITHTFTNQILDHRDSALNIERWKQGLRRAGNELGISVAEFGRQLNGAIYRAYLEPNLDLHNRFSWAMHYGQKWMRDTFMVGLVNTNTKYIRSYLDDGLDHLAGFGLLACTAHGAKNLMGKKLWKRMCRNSKTRNDTICKLTTQPGSPHPDTSKTLIHFLDTVPSTLLRTQSAMVMYYTTNSTGYTDIVGKIIRHLGVPMYKMDAESIGQQCNTINDAHTMINRAGGVFNPRWSLRRLKREHDNANAELLKKSSSKTPYDMVKVLPNTIEQDGFVATLVRSQLELSMLGASEHHCVASYHHVVKRSEYAVYVITDEAGTRSTIGISHPNNDYSRDQHYYAWDKVITDDARKAFGVRITHHVRRIMEEKITFSPRPGSVPDAMNIVPAAPAVVPPVVAAQLDLDAPNNVLIPPPGRPVYLEHPDHLNQGDDDDAIPF